VPSIRILLTAERLFQVRRLARERYCRIDRKQMDDCGKFNTFSIHYSMHNMALCQDFFWNLLQKVIIALGLQNHGA